MKTIVRWDPHKAASNLRKHRVSFEEAAAVFHDPLSITIVDPLHSEMEDRFAIIGQSAQKRLLVVVHTDEWDIVRIISARMATAHERRKYEEGGYEEGLTSAS